MSSPTALTARFGRPGLAPLWQALRARHERAGDKPVRRVRVGPLDAAARHALAELLGFDRLPGEYATVSVDRLDELVRAVLPGADARTVVEALDGPIVDRAAAAQKARRERDALWDWLTEHPRVAAEPALEAWVEVMRRNGIVAGSVAATRRLFERALAVLAALPADGRPLPLLAAQVCDDAHALDDDRRLSAVVLRAVATLRGVALPGDAAGRRELWAQVGVACDELSTSVLVAGLRPREVTGPLATSLRAWAGAGQASWITLAQLRGAPPVAVDGPVWVVENPSVVAEALRRFGVACPPVVCTSGWPTSAAMQLLRALRDGGARLAYHGDLDGEGVRIAAHVVDRAAATPVAMTADDYLAAARPGGPPVGRVTEAPWDPGLAHAMRERGVAVHQEDVCDQLLARMVADTEETGPVWDAVNA